MKGKYLNEIARDVISFGSPVFFVMVLVRVSLLPHPEYLSQFLISGCLFFLVAFLLKIEKRTGLGLVILIFTSIYYNNLKFTYFGVGLYLIFIGSLYYLKTKKIEIMKSFILGIISAGIGYYTVKMIF